MGIFRKKESEFYTEEPAEVRFEAMMNLVKDLSRKDYNRLKKAMDSGYEAYQTIRNLDALDDDSEIAVSELMVSKEEK